MVFCRICKAEIGFLGWPNHVRMHKKRVEGQIGHWPTWNEVLEVCGVVPRQATEAGHYCTLRDFEVVA